MKHSVMTGRPMRPRVPQALIAAGLLVLACLLPSTSSAAEASELSKESVACLKCHDKPGMEKALENGEKLSLHVSTQEYADSMHNETNCEDCHADLDAKTHGKVKTAIKSKRDFAHSMRETCRDCHKKKFTQYDDSVHAALVKDGSKKAPLCADCHNPHTQRSVKIAEPISATPCAAHAAPPPPACLVPAAAALVPSCGATTWPRCRRPCSTTATSDGPHAAPRRGRDRWPPVTPSNPIH